MSEQKTFFKIRMEGWLLFNPEGDAEGPVDLDDIANAMAEGEGICTHTTCVKSLTIPEALQEEEFAQDGAHDFYAGWHREFQAACEAAEAHPVVPHPHYTAATEQAKVTQYGGYISVCPFCGKDDVRLVSYVGTCCLQVLHDGWDLSDGPCDTSEERFKCLSCEKMVPAAYVFIDGLEVKKGA